MFFVDGYNLYHAIDALSDTDIQFKDCKWLDLQALCKNYVNSSFEEFTGIKYFTALSWKPQSQIRQRIYINALTYQCQNKIDIIYGKFKKRTRYCNLCKQKFTAHEEKLTDVNIAISLFENALKNTFDEAVIISADSDLIPSILAIKRIFPGKLISILPPHKSIAVELVNCTHKHYKMKASALLKSLLPNPVSNFYAPDNWQSKNYKFDEISKTYVHSF